MSISGMAIALVASLGGLRTRTGFGVVVEVRCVYV